jgi:hypothetical protein
LSSKKEDIEATTTGQSCQERFKEPKTSVISPGCWVVARTVVPRTIPGAVSGVISWVARNRSGLLSVWSGILIPPRTGPCGKPPTAVVRCSIIVSSHLSLLVIIRMPVEVSHLAGNSGSWEITEAAEAAATTAGIFVRVLLIRRRRRILLALLPKHIRDRLLFAVDVVRWKR